MPVIFGIFRSVIIKSNFVVFSRVTATGPSLAATTSCPSLANVAASESRIISWSSTISIFAMTTPEPFPAAIKSLQSALLSPPRRITR
jgi:hypothetical protein